MRSLGPLIFTAKISIWSRFRAICTGTLTKYVQAFRAQQATLSKAMDNIETSSCILSRFMKQVNHLAGLSVVGPSLAYWHL